MKRQCDEYAKLGLLGVTMLFSSGDNGVGGNGGLCIDNSGGQSTSGKIFNPRLEFVFLSSSPEMLTSF
jgi:tripeptidyl-peptidase-1